LAAVALTTDSSVLTAIANDYAYADVFARQVGGLARPGDVVVGISTSGGSENVLRGLAAARRRGALTVALTGRGGAMREHADHVLEVPSDDTARIQEMHILLIHLLSEVVDAWAAEHEDTP
jgi:D-sedoheptulose 7-phosphate isomerase